MTIKVATIFEKGLLKPVWFIFEKRKYEIKQIHYRWETKDGAAKVYHFSVNDGTNVHELSFHDKEMTWKLIRTES